MFYESNFFLIFSCVNGKEKRVKRVKRVERVFFSVHTENNIKNLILKQRGSVTCIFNSGEDFCEKMINCGRKHSFLTTHLAIRDQLWN